MNVLPESTRDCWRNKRRFKSLFSAVNTSCSRLNLFGLKFHWDPVTIFTLRYLIYFIVSGYLYNETMFSYKKQIKTQHSLTQLLLTESLWVSNEWMFFFVKFICNNIFIHRLRLFLWPRVTAAERLPVLSTQYKRFIGLKTHFQAGRSVHGIANPSRAGLTSRTKLSRGQSAHKEPWKEQISITHLRRVWSVYKDLSICPTPRSNHWRFVCHS